MLSEAAAEIEFIGSASILTKSDMVARRGCCFYRRGQQLLSRTDSNNQRYETQKRRQDGRCWWMSLVVNVDGFVIIIVFYNPMVRENGLLILTYKKKIRKYLR